MYQRILLAYDGSREGLVALREGALLAKRCGAKVWLLCVLPTSHAGVVAGDGSYFDLSGHQLDTYKELLARGVAVGRQLGLEPVAKLIIGEPATQIGAFAREIDADLVVLGHRRQNLLERWWSGATGAFVTDQVSCSVLVGRKVISDEVFEAELKVAEDA